MNLDLKLLVLYGEWLKRCDADLLMYSNTCICHASKLRCAGHITYKDSLDGKEQLWPARHTKRLEDETVELTITYGRQRVLHTYTRYLWWDVEQQAAYGPDFETRKLADKFRAWLGGKDVRTWDPDNVMLWYSWFKVGFPAPEWSEEPESK